MTSEMSPQKYIEIVKYLLDNFRYAIKFADYFEDPSSWSKIITKLLLSTKRLLPILKGLILEEFRRTEASGGGNFSSVLRGNDFTTKIIAKLVSISGSEYLRQLLGDLIAGIVLDKDLDLEVDPSRLGSHSLSLTSSLNLQKKFQKSQEDLENRHKLLVKKAQAFLDRIVDPKMVRFVPRDFRAIASYLAECAREYAPDEILPIIGGFVMLRFISAAIATPESFNLLPSNKPTVIGKERRNLVLIAKFLQNLSNSVIFGDKEDYLSCATLNNFIVENQQKMNDYLLTLIEDPLQTDTVPAWADYREVSDTFDLSDIPPSELLEFHRLLSYCAQKATRELQNTEQRIDAMKAAMLRQREFVVIRMIEDLGPPPSAAITISQDLRTSPHRSGPHSAPSPQGALVASPSAPPHPMLHSHSLSSLRLPSFRSSSKHRRRRSGHSHEEPTVRDTIRHRTTDFTEAERMQVLSAVKSGDVLQLLQVMKDLDVDSLAPIPLPECVSQVEDGWLHIAAGFDNPKFMGFLLKASGVDVNSLSKELWSPLHVAAQAGHLSICELLLREGASVNTRTNTGALPIHYFVTHNFSKRTGLEEVKTFRRVFTQLSNGGKLLNETTNSQETPLHYACTRFQSEDNVILLLRHHVDCNSSNKRGHTPLHICIMNQRRKLVRLLLDYGARQDLTCVSGTCAQLAANDSETLAILTAYPKPIIEGVADILEELKAAAESANLDRLAAALEDRSFSIRELPEPPSSANDGRSWLHLAAARGNRRLTKVLLRATDIELDGRSVMGWTPLHEASQTGAIYICHDLIEVGMGVTVRDNEGLVPLHLFVAHNYETRNFLETYEFLEVFESLLGKPEDLLINSRSLQGDTPLHYACKANALINTSLLLQAGASPNHCNNLGGNALHLAILSRNPALVRVLLSAGADISIRHTQLGSCLEIAKSASCPELVSMLKDALIK